MISKNQHLTRQLDLIPLAILDTPINLIGAGAIGSFTALALAKMGFTNITAIDFDTIDVENMNCQFYRFKDIGKPKVQALQELIEDFTGIEINAVNDMWNGAILEGITICAVDNMKVRKEIFETHGRKAFNTKAIIDPRMGAETALMFSYSPISPSELEDYKTTLYSDENAIQERCTAKSTMYTACMLSGLVAKTVKNILCDEESSKNLMWDINKDDMCTLKRG
ncbi:MAG: ThiF family adenylyltransferase [Candidatus Lokiarchaeota archaeon]|nr:ThiF family adenylyltransferase [Candidatus Lokiarchaeota archaeon]